MRASYLGHYCEDSSRAGRIHGWKKVCSLWKSGLIKDTYLEVVVL